MSRPWRPWIDPKGHSNSSLRNASLYKNAFYLQILPCMVLYLESCKNKNTKLKIFPQNMRTPKNKLREGSLRNTGKNVKLWVGDPKSGSRLSWISWVAPWQVASHLRAHVPALLRPLSSGNENTTSWGHPEDKGKHLWTRRAVPGICQRQNQRSRSSSSSLFVAVIGRAGRCLVVWKCFIFSVPVFKEN